MGLATLALVVAAGVAQRDAAAAAELAPHAAAGLQVLITTSELAVGENRFAFGLLAYASAQWLQSAHWQPLTVAGTLDFWPTTRAWVAHPQAWHGLHRVVSYLLRVPLYIIVAGVGVVMLVFSRA